MQIERTQYPFMRVGSGRIAQEISEILEKDLFEAMTIMASSQVEDMPRFLNSKNHYLASMAKERLDGTL